MQPAAAVAHIPFPQWERDREEGQPQTPGSGASLLPTSPPRCRARKPPRWTNWRCHSAVLLAAPVALLGLVLFGQGIWIYAKACLAQILLERAFAQTLATGHDVKPWSWADTWPVARIEVPRLKASVIVLHGSSGHALAFGPGHVELTPEAGEPGTAVYAAHRDTHFTFLSDLRIGDDIRVTRHDGTVVRFRVTETSVVRWDASGIDPFAPGRHLVLATCWPFNARTGGPLRYLVQAELVEASAARS